MANANDAFKRLNSELQKVAAALHAAMTIALSQGRRAFEDGLDYEENPYPEQSRMHGLWLCGYFGVKSNQELPPCEGK